MAESPFGIALSEESRALIASLTPDITFSDGQLLLGLDKRLDFRHADLSGIDFSKSDLRGFDFTGADLRFSYGVSVLWDNTTILDEAIYDESLFSYRDSSPDFFADDENSKLFSLLKGFDWGEQIQSMYGMSKRPASRERTEQFAKRLFLESGDASVQSDMLRILGVTTLSRQDYIAFLMHVCTIADDAKHLVAATRVLADRFCNFEAVFPVLFALTRHANERVKDIAYAGIFRSNFFESIKSEISARIALETNEAIRRSYVERMSSFVPDSEMIVKSDRRATRFVDFAVPLTTQFLTRQADRYNQSLTTIARKAAELMEAGIPFRFADNIVRSAITNMRLQLRADKNREERARRDKNLANP